MVDETSLLLAIKLLLVNNITCEDNEIFISNKFKYDVFNLITSIDKEFKKNLFRELEYSEEE